MRAAGKKDCLTITKKRKEIDYVDIYVSNSMCSSFCSIGKCWNEHRHEALQVNFLKYLNFRKY